ncbi:AHH domain-containing protein [Archangium lansingense]|uniref:AHH domain-containing protein n=1 Tax=Archangium lansingense TaxID=2995310 RepID=A0ABT3ZVT6_9BACT|nr:AHH domain-containing protein [Archangium lansinium]MCY1073505.1 AHH domain-containing protein [Archangium lansinium]
MSTCSWPRMAVALWLVLAVSCVTSPEELPLEGRNRVQPKVVRTSALPGGALRLTFEPVAPAPVLEQLRVEEARAVLAAFHESFPREKGRRFRLVRTSTEPGPEEWEQRLREEFVSRYGPPVVPLPGALETSPVFLALKLSPRYMGEGVRDAAQELFSSRLFLSSVALSVLVYFAAWVAPEPIFTKAFVTALTLRVALVVGVLELNQFARACARLYQEAEAARTVEELEAVAERFGKAVGGTGLRVLMLVASMGVAKGLPEVPQGGLGALLRAPRYSLPGGISMGSASTVQMVADGTIIATGVAAGTAAASPVGSACTDGSESQDGYHWHHLATNKNDISERFGGPWTPRFEQLFELAGMSLDAAENLVYLKGHKGPHPEAYHEAVFEKLNSELRDCGAVSRCRGKLLEALGRLAEEVCTPGSRLHRLVTKSHE